MDDISTTINGQDMFAFNDREDPWHRKGTDVSGYMDIDAALMASHTDWLVTEQPIFILVNGQPQVIEGRKATVRTEDTLGANGFESITHVLGDVGSAYCVEQNRDTVQWAFDLAGVSNGEAVVDTIGALGNGEEFFVGLDLGTVTLDPGGLNDAVNRYLVVRNGHNGSVSLQAFDTNIRVVCRNTLEWAQEGARKGSRVLRVKHTSGKEGRKALMVATIEAARAGTAQLIANSTAMMQTPTTQADLIRVADAIWAKPEVGAAKAAVTKHANRIDVIKAVYSRPTNAGGYGDTAWSLYNTFTEYLDWDRPIRKGTDLSTAQGDPEGITAGIKAKVAQLVLA